MWLIAMNEFRESFQKTASQLSAAMVVPGELRNREERDVFVLPKQGIDGFETSRECMDHGVYPTAEGWHGGCWDVTVFKPQELSTGLKEFVLSILHNAALEVHCSGGNPYKRVLHYRFEGARVQDETGLLFYSWFGRPNVRNIPMPSTPLNKNRQYATLSSSRRHMK